VVGIAPCRRSRRQHNAIWPPAQQRDGVPWVLACRWLWRRPAGLDLCPHILLQRGDMPSWLHTFHSALRLQRLTTPDRRNNSVVAARSLQRPTQQAVSSPSKWPNTSSGSAGGDITMAAWDSVHCEYIVDCISSQRSCSQCHSLYQEGSLCLSMKYTQAVSVQT
jgi:hypothetical protein